MSNWDVRVISLTVGIAIVTDLEDRITDELFHSKINNIVRLRKATQSKATGKITVEYFLFDFDYIDEEEDEDIAEIMKDVVYTAVNNYTKYQHRYRKF